jgi:hypothetical protein
MNPTRENIMTISKKETRGKRKARKRRLTGQQEEELKKGKDGWDTTLNVPTRDGRAGIMASTKPLQMH